MKEREIKENRRKISNERNEMVEFFLKSKVKKSKIGNNVYISIYQQNEVKIRMHRNRFDSLLFPLLCFVTEFSFFSFLLYYCAHILHVYTWWNSLCSWSTFTYLASDWNLFSILVLIDSFERYAYVIWFRNWFLRTHKFVQISQYVLFLSTTWMVYQKMSITMWLFNVHVLTCFFFLKKAIKILKFHVFSSILTETV